jgi:hypothetical protein
MLQDVPNSEKFGSDEQESALMTQLYQLGGEVGVIKKVGPQSLQWLFYPDGRLS